jgi:hypothetical protein
LSPGWTRYLHKLMAIAHKRKRVTDEELEQALGETIIRGVAVPHRAAAADTPAAPDALDREDVEPPEGAEWLGP